MGNTPELLFGKLDVTTRPRDAKRKATRGKQQEETRGPEAWTKRLGL
jgi:hypothetical protein